jgi:hypothetical protein
MSTNVMGFQLSHQITSKSIGYFKIYPTIYFLIKAEQYPVFHSLNIKGEVRFLGQQNAQY